MKRNNRRKNQSVFKRLSGPFIWIFILASFYLLLVLAHGTYTDFQPDDQIQLEALQKGAVSSIQDSAISFIIWNVGFGGLGAESNFFYDSGGFFISGNHMVRASRPLVEKNIEGALRFIRSNPADFYLFQEVDVSSKRSYDINQLELYQQQLPDYATYYATNLRVGRIPVPILQPWNVYGRVESGLASFSRFQAKNSTRLQLPGDYAWPNRVFMLDRCLLVNRYTVKGAKELIVLNVHNSAYDSKGELKSLQMEFIRQFAMEEYNKGNFVVAGGDWNQCPPFFQFDGFMPGKTQGYTQINMDGDFFPEGWQWIYDPALPTNRKTHESFLAGSTFVTTIDFYLLSPNLKARKIKTIDQAFLYSDHQPVFIELELL